MLSWVDVVLLELLNVVLLDVVRLELLAGVLVVVALLELVDVVLNGCCAGWMLCC